EYGSFVGILVDYDAVGSEIPKAARTTTSIIGTNKETIRWLQQNRYEITLVEVATSVDVLIGKINYKMFACKNSCPHRAALLSKGQLKPSDNRIVCYMHCFEYNVFTGKLERIPNKWMNQSQGWKKSGELILYDVIENEDGSVFVDIAEEPINA
ncbi:MAG: Rieske 2Fe-2S domain-containing protein, partial [Candidatus Nitrosopolaris sp.]